MERLRLSRLNRNKAAAAAKEEEEDDGRPPVEWATGVFVTPGGNKFFKEKKRENFGNFFFPGGHSTRPSPASEVVQPVRRRSGERVSEGEGGEDLGWGAKALPRVARAR